MASSEVVSTNPDLPRDSCIPPLSSLLSDLHHPMDHILNNNNNDDDDDNNNNNPVVDDVVWDDIVAANNAAAVADHAAITLEDFLLTKSRDEGGVIPPPAAPVSDSCSIPFSMPLPEEGGSSSVEALGGGNGSVQKGKRRAVEEPVDKATLQKQRRMIKNRESAARSRERKQAYTSELEYLVHQLEQENAQLLNEEAEMRRQRKKQLFECIIPIEVMPKPKKKLRRVNSAQSL